ncbi:ABC transporter substrate-binding protein [Kitasatospora viridis]|uniref:Peptide/nickel transport system substrate-binding protein n=1 Tax=Kitasatospora viridis TaxID=281105 RepID=A0A561UNN3_9ACTN|nr:ABC transporter substrate-binding protein [Kitasatospora viridis]TWG00962.1 peptide/nickel transport system substrate-binding protein [Kitasatospora viridis]
MTRRTHAALAAAIAATLTLGLGACGKNKHDDNNSQASGGPGLTTQGDGIVGGTPVKGGTLHILSNQDLSQLDPARNWTEQEMDFGIRLLYRTLTTFKAAPGQAGSQVVGDLATDTGEPSDGDKTWTFHLKDGLKYEDGTPIVTQDIKYNVERSYDPDLSGGPDYARKYLVAPAGYKGPLKGGDLGNDSIETPDAKTIVFHLVRPVADFGSTVTLPTFAPVPKAHEGGTTYGAHVFSSGPYKIQSYDRGKQLTLVRNTNWDPSTDSVRMAYPDKIVMDQTGSPEGIADRLIADQGDDQSAIMFADMAASKVADVITNPDVKARLVSESENCTGMVALDTAKAPFNNQNARLAVEYGLDKQAYQTAVGGPALSDIATTYLPPELTGGTGVDHFKIPPTGDPAKAKQYLAAAGTPNGFSTDLTADNAQKPQAEAIQAALKNVGITVNLNIVDASVATATIGDKDKQTGMSLNGWCPDWPAGSTFLPMLFDSRIITDTGNSGNTSRFSDPAVDAEIDRISAMTDATAANQAWLALDAKIMDEAPEIPVSWQKKPLLVGSNIAGAFGSPIWEGEIDYATIGLKSAK